MVFALPRTAERTALNISKWRLERNSEAGRSYPCYGTASKRACGLGEPRRTARDARLDIAALHGVAWRCSASRREIAKGGRRK